MEPLRDTVVAPGALTATVDTVVALGYLWNHKEIL